MRSYSNISTSWRQFVSQPWLVTYLCILYQCGGWWKTTVVACSNLVHVNCITGVCAKQKCTWFNKVQLSQLLRLFVCHNQLEPSVLGNNLAKTGTSALNGPIMKQHEAYRAIFCTLKTTSGFTFLLPVVWSDLATNRKPVGLVSKAISDLWCHGVVCFYLPIL